ncbi:hypothetical protein GDO78_004451 [Eleutherodactylus coqui]|uniref:Uncharacterized protein n=1 Tax=Eleutherodactylus coqui TaxID=57060 RepID=A0A8J6K0E2_ELECQ|nr:hypothetical protein GDO78_004451 [Eleutherodactylus coqui]
MTSWGGKGLNKALKPPDNPFKMVCSPRHPFFKNGKALDQLIDAGSAPIKSYCWEKANSKYSLNGQLLIEELCILAYVV